MIEVSVRELKNRLTHYLRRLEAGERITVTRRGKPVGVLSPVGEAAEETPGERHRRKLQMLLERGVISQIAVGKPKGLDPPIKLIGEGPTISEMVLEDRG